MDELYGTTRATAARRLITCGGLFLDWPHSVDLASPELACAGARSWTSLTAREQDLRPRLMCGGLFLDEPHSTRACPSPHFPGRQVRGLVLGRVSWHPRGNTPLTVRGLVLGRASWYKLTNYWLYPNCAGARSWTSFMAPTATDEDIECAGVRSWTSLIAHLLDTVEDLCGGSFLDEPHSTNLGGVIF